ncbi:MAG TPA: hypothetical protein PLY96_11725 [Chromatiaceae bacterium]|jgi:hypothetical protein|nr:hypothetical protein [Chromatiaceae bacterium]
MKLKNGHAKRAIEDAERSLHHLDKLIDLPRYPGIPAGDQAFVRYRLNALANALSDVIVRLHDLQRGAGR